MTVGALVASGPAAINAAAEVSKSALNSVVRLKPITVWKRYYKGTKTAPGRYEHNHIEDGHTERDRPKPMCNEQMKAWHGADGWGKTLAYLDKNSVVVAA